MIEGFFSPKPPDVRNSNGQRGMIIRASEDVIASQKRWELKLALLPTMGGQTFFASGRGEIEVDNREGGPLFRMYSEVQLPDRGWETRIAFGKEQLPRFSAQVLGQIPGATAVRLESNQLKVTASPLTGFLGIKNPPRLCQVDYQNGSGFLLAHSGHQGDWEVKVRSNGRKTLEIKNPPPVMQLSVPQGSQIVIDRRGTQNQTYRNSTICIRC